MPTDQPIYTAPSDQQLAEDLFKALKALEIRGIDVSKLLYDGQIISANLSEPIVNVQRRGVRIVGNAFDISRVSQACQTALKHFEQNRQDPTNAVTVVVHPPQDDEP